MKKPTPLLLALLIIPNLIFIAYDQSVWVNDDAHFASDAIKLFYTLTHQPGTWLSELFRISRIKTPGLIWLAQFFVPLGDALGRIEFGLLGFSVLVSYLTILFQYRLLKEIGIQRSSTLVAALLFLAGAPLFVTLSHRFFTDALQTLFLVMTLWIYERDRNAPYLHRVAGLLFGTICLTLAKISSPLYVSFLWIHLALSYRRGSALLPSINARRAIFYGATLLLFATLTTWLTMNWQNVLRFTWSITFGVPAEEIQSQGYSFGSNLANWLINTKYHFFTWPSLFALQISVCLFLCYGGFRSARARSGWFYFAQLAFFYLFHSAQYDQEGRHLIPLLPFLVCFLAQCLESLTLVRVQALCAVAMALHYLQSSIHLLGGWKNDPTYDHSRTFGLYNPFQTSPDLKREVERVATAACQTPANERTMVWVNCTNRKLVADKSGMQFAFLREPARRSDLFRGKCTFDYLSDDSSQMAQIKNRPKFNFRVITLRSELLKEEYSNRPGAPVRIDEKVRQSGLFTRLEESPRYGFEILTLARR